MKVYNQGGRIFKIAGGIDVRPGVFTEIPEAQNEAAELLLKNYPTEIITDELASANAKAKDVTIASLQERVAALEKENAALKEAAATPSAPVQVAKKK